jgi:CrcB protein
VDPRFFGVVALGGAIGSMLRYGVAVFFAMRFGGGFPLGTLLINVTGSFVIGAIAEFSVAHNVSPLLRTFLMVGILGGYTTFSSFSLDIVTLASRGIWLSALYACSSVILGLLAALAGIAVTRAFA